MKTTHDSHVVRLLLLGCITLSVTVMYYTYIVNKDYVVFTNADGIPTTEK